MPRKPRRPRRPSQVVRDELETVREPWDLEKHLKGCLTGYQAATSYGTAVYFALEAISGIARDVEVRAETGKLDPGKIDTDWTIPPTTNLPVQWLWIRALAEAWGRYMIDGGPLGHAFGLEGGQGKPGIDAKLAQMLDERAIARWIWNRKQEARAAGEKLRIIDVIHEAAEKFNKSDVTIRRAWERFGSAERQRHPK